MCISLSSVQSAERIICHSIESFGHRHGLKEGIAIFKNLPEEEIGIGIFGGKDSGCVVLLP